MEIIVKRRDSTTSWIATFLVAILLVIEIVVTYSRYPDVSWIQWGVLIATILVFLMGFLHASYLSIAQGEIFRGNEKGISFTNKRIDIPYSDIVSVKTMRLGWLINVGFVFTIKTKTKKYEVWGIDDGEGIAALLKQRIGR